MQEKQYHILVIENVESDFVRIRENLEKGGGFVVTAAPLSDPESVDLEEAFEYFCEIEPEGVIIDLGLDVVSDKTYKTDFNNTIEESKNSIEDTFGENPEKFGGWLLARHIRKVKPDIPILIFTKWALDVERWNRLQLLAGDKYIPLLVKNAANFEGLGRQLRKLFDGGSS